MSANCPRANYLGDYQGITGEANFFFFGGGGGGGFLFVGWGGGGGWGGAIVLFPFLPITSTLLKVIITKTN